MTSLRTAAQQALEALTNCSSEYGHRCNRCDSEVDEGGKVAAALRAALAQQEEPVQKPVAWLQPKTVDGYSRPDLGYETCSKDDYGAFPVYRASPKAEPEQEPVAWMFTDREGTEFFEQREDWDGWWTPLYTAPPQRQPQTLDAAMQQPRSMAQAYENGYKAGVAAEREECAQVCEARFVGDLNREDMEARRCAAAIRARGNT